MVGYPRQCEYIVLDVLNGLGILIRVLIFLFLFVVFGFLSGVGDRDHGRRMTAKCVASFQPIESLFQIHPSLPCLQYWKVSPLPFGSMGSKLHQWRVLEEL